MLDEFLTLLHGDRPHSIVWTADITYWMEGEKHAGRYRPSWDTEEGYLELHSRLGIMPYYYYDKFFAAKPKMDSSISISQEKHGGVTLRTIETPLGTLTEEQRFLADSCSVGCTKHLVQSVSDLDILLCVLEHRQMETCNLVDYRRRMDLWRRYDGLPSIGLPRSPLASLCHEWMGVENMVYIMADNIGKFEKALSIMERQDSQVVDAVCELGPPLVHFPDNLSGDIFAGFYDKYMGPAHKRRIEKLHGAGIKCAVHHDGSVAGLLPKLINCGFDAIEALTPQPAGDMTMHDILDVAGSHSVILWGGVPGTMFAPPYAWDAMEKHVTELLQCWGNRPFVLGVADQVPPDGDIGFCKLIADLIRRR